MAQTQMLNTGVLYTDRRDFYLDPNEYAELWPSTTPFTTLTTKMGMKKAKDPDFRMFEYRSGWHNAYFLLNDGDGIILNAVDSTVSVVFDSATGVHPNVGDKFDVYSSDDVTYHGQVIVDSVTTTGVTGTITVRTIKLSSASVADNAKFYLMGNSQEEGSGSPGAWSQELDIAYNTTEIIKTPVEVTGTILEAALRGASNELARLRGNKAKEHAMKRELSRLFGRRLSGIGYPETDHVTGPDGKMVRTSHGLLPILEDHENGANIHEISKANYNYSKFLDLMKTVYEYGNDESKKVMMVGDDMLAWLGTFVEGKSIAGKVDFQMPIASDKFGFNIRTLMHQFGILEIVRSPLLTQHAGGKYSGYGLIVDPMFVNEVTYRADAYQAAIQNNDIDGVKDQYFSDSGLGLTMVEAHHAISLK